MSACATGASRRCGRSAHAARAREFVGWANARGTTSGIRRSLARICPRGHSCVRFAWAQRGSRSVHANDRSGRAFAHPTLRCARRKCNVPGESDMSDVVDDGKRDFLKQATLLTAAGAVGAAMMPETALAQVLETGVREDSVLAKCRKEGVLRVGY